MILFVSLLWVGAESLVWVALVLALKDLQKMER